MVISRAFCINKSGGNLAGIMLNGNLNDEQKQNYVKNDNLPVIVFISHQNSIYKLRFFYQNYETNLCIHGALCAANFIHNIDKSENYVILDKYNNKLKFDHQNNLTSLVLNTESLNTVERINIDLVDIYNILNVDQMLIKNIYASIKLFIEFKDEVKLNDIKPNFELIKDWCISNNINGIYIYSYAGTKSDLVARSFNPISGQNEDNATGIAALMLSALLKKSLVIIQNQTSKIVVNYTNHTISISAEVIQCLV